MLQIALYQPDIAPNAATIIRMAACFGLKVIIIEPTGFIWNAQSFRRAGMDYLDRAHVTRLPSWAEFQKVRGSARVILLSTKAQQSYVDFEFHRDDILLLGRESAGVPDAVHTAVDGRVLIPMKGGERSLNIALACAMVTGEALRQTGGFVGPVLP